MDRLELDTSLEGLAILKKRYSPEGSGPRHAMRMIISLIDLLAEEKGYDLNSVEVIYLNGKYLIERKKKNNP